MTRPATSPVIEQQRAHRSIRVFRNEPIEPLLLAALIQAGQAAPSSSFIQAYSVIRVTRPAARRAIAEAAGGQVWIERAPEFLVFCADLRRIDAASRKAGSGKLEGYAEHGVAAIVDVSLMAANVLLAAESVGLGGVCIGGIRNDPRVIVDKLNIPKLVVPVFGMCLGWPADAPEVKPRMPVDLVLHQDEYRDASEERIVAYDNTLAAYYRSRSANTKRSDWSSTAASSVQGKKREHMLAFLQQQGFFKR